MHSKQFSSTPMLKLSLDHDFAVVIMDVQMPDLDGIDTANLMRRVEKTRKTPVIFVTAINSDDAYIAKGYEAGAVDYLFKPVNAHVLRSKVNVFIELYRQKIALQKEIDEREAAQRKTAEILDKLESTNEELNQFAYIISHDLKAPLRTVGLLTEILARDYSAKIGEAGQEYLNLVVNASHRMQSLIDGVLEYSKAGRGEGRVALYKLDEIVKSVLRTLVIPDNIQVSVKGSFPKLRCDGLQVSQIFQNLITNAIKFSDKPEGRIELGVVEHKAFYRFYVEDNGSGIEKKSARKIFNIFETLGCSESTDSTGVGLSIVKKIVEKGGGKIWVKSERKRGSTFFFTLPKSNTR
ncbi:MAG: ATP-binding protein [Nitrospinota bacterium]